MATGEAKDKPFGEQAALHSDSASLILDISMRSSQYK
jgi:hypothetical protein